MSPDEKSRLLTADLVERIEADLSAASDQAQTCADFVAGLNESRSTPDAPGMAFVAVAIDRAYTALEAAFVRVAREIDAVVPVGEDWHAALLHQMTLPIQDRRAAVLASSTAAKLDPLRRHRHWLRHAYSATFSWAAMEATARSLPDAVSAARVDLEAFVRFLQGS